MFNPQPKPENAPNIRKAQERQYSVDRKAFLLLNERCLVCGGFASQVHHKAGRIGALLLDQSLWLPVCAGCHVNVENHTVWAKKRGFSIDRL